MVKKVQKNKPYLPKINAILVGLIASIILNLLLIAPYMALLTTKMFDTTGFSLFLERTYNLNDEVTLDGKKWTCVRPEFLPLDWRQEGKKLCTTDVLLDKNNQEIK